jgi:hypothetical protein
MSEAQLLSVVGALFAIVVGGLAWIGNRIFGKLDKLSDQMSENRELIGDRLDDVHDRIGNIDKRLTAVEVRCNFEHGK